MSKLWIALIFGVGLLVQIGCGGLGNRYSERRGWMWLGNQCSERRGWRWLGLRLTKRKEREPFVQRCGFWVEREREREVGV